jgi:protein gp37
MAQGSGIEWTESTWNPVTGCSKISPGCKHCYAERMAERLQQPSLHRRACEVLVLGATARSIDGSQPLGH